MPLYEFRCPNGHDFEKFYRSIGTAPSEEKCPGCGVLAARVMSLAGLVFKGSGFYITDYGKDGKKAEREAATAKETAKAEASKPDASKPEAAKSDAKSGEAPAQASEAPAQTAPPKPAATSASDAAPAKSSTASKPKSE